MNQEEPNLDPYLQWLGIRDPERSPNHYRMLGIEVFESDPDVISNAADRQMAHVRTFQSGKNAQLSQRILNEIASSKVCLLDPEKKAAYDADLQSKIQISAPPVDATLENGDANAFRIETNEDSFLLNRPRRGTRLKRRWLVVVVCLAPMAIGVVGAWQLGFFHRGETAQNIPKKQDDIRPDSNNQPNTSGNQTENGEPLVQPSVEHPKLQNERPVKTNRQPNTSKPMEPTPIVESNDVDVAPWDLPRPKTKPFKINDTSNPMTIFVLSLAKRDVEEAKALLTSGISNSIKLSADQLDELEMYVTTQKQFWDSVNRTVSAMRPNSTILFRGQPVAVVRVTNTSMQIQAKNTERKTFLTSAPSMDPDLAISLVLYDHRNQLPVAWRLIASFLSLDQFGDMDLSEQYLQRAKHSGMSVTSIESVLKLLKSLSDPPRFSGDHFDPVPVGSLESTRRKQRLRIPGASALRLAIRMLNQDTGLKIDVRTPVGRKKTIGQLQVFLEKSELDPVMRYAAFDLVRELSFRDGDAVTTLRSINTLCMDYENDFSELIQRTWSDSNAPHSIQPQDLVKASIEVMHDQIRNEAFHLASVLLTFAESKSADLPVQLELLASAREELKTATELSQGAFSALPVIRENEQDHAANLAIGNFLCFVRQDFRGGLPYLARSHVSGLNELAMNDLTNQDSRPNPRLSRQWQAIAQSHSGLLRRGMLARATFWNASPDVTTGSL